MFGSRGVSHLRSIHSDFELIELLINRLKNLAGYEVKAKSNLKTNRYHHLLSDIEEQHKLLGSIEMLVKMKIVRLNELNNQVIKIVNDKINALKNQKYAQEMEFKKYMSNIKKSNTNREYEAQIRYHHERNIRKIEDDIRHYETLLNALYREKKVIRESCINNIRDFKVMTRI